MSGTANRADMIHNETLKPRANALDRASTACIAIGVFAPTVAGGAQPILGAVAWLSIMVAPHFLAARVLRGLR